jgi:hypothetical protein
MAQTQHLRRKIKECICIFAGHKWEIVYSQRYDKTGAEKTIAQRTYCSRCGVKYHEHKYKQI